MRKYLTSAELLEAAPWLGKYGARLTNALARFGVRSVDDILSVTPDELSFRFGGGPLTRIALRQAQDELRRDHPHDGHPPEEPLPGADGVGVGARPTSQDLDSPAAPPADDGAVDLVLALILDKYPTRLRNSLGRYGLDGARAIVELSPDEFASMRGVGAGQVAVLRELQAEVEALLRGDIPVPAAAAGPPQPEAPPEARTSPTPGLVLPECAQAPVSSIWYIWDGTPTRLRNALEGHGLLSVSDILRLEPEDIAGFRAVGKRTIADLAQLQVQLRDWVVRQGGVVPDVGREDACGYNGQVVLAPESSTLDGLLTEVVNGVCAAREGAADTQRDSALWLGHFGIGPGEARTLEELGEVHSITRERVRQIVSVVTRRVRQEFGANRTLAVLGEKLDSLFARCLGVAEATAFAATLQGETGWVREPSPSAVAALAEALEGSPHAFVVTEGDGLIRHVDMCQALWQRATAQAANLLREMDEGLHLLDYAYRLSGAIQNGCSLGATRSTTVVPCCGAACGAARLPETYVRALLAALDPSPLDGETVLSHWQAVLRNGRRKVQVIEAALRVIGRPVHFTELTRFICAHNPRFSSADERYIHGRLVNSDHYVLTGKLGTYGLAEWGEEQYLTVADRVEGFLRERGHAVAVRDIVRAFRAQGVPENNVRVCLGQSRFANDGGGAIRLAEWDRAGTAANGGESGRSVGVFIDDDEGGFIIG